MTHGSVVGQPACQELALRAYAEQHSPSRYSKASQTLIRHRAVTSDIICLASVKEVATAENFELVVTLLRMKAVPHNHRPLFLCRHDTQWRLGHISTLTSAGRRQLTPDKQMQAATTHISNLFMPSTSLLSAASAHYGTKVNMHSIC